MHEATNNVILTTANSGLTPMMIITTPRTADFANDTIGSRFSHFRFVGIAVGLD